MITLPDDLLFVFRYPILLLLVSFCTLWLSARLGATRFKKLRSQVGEMKGEFDVIQGATLTLLALIIGFTFSMAVGRYEQRKNYEEAEANAIGTQYLRAGILPAPDAEKVRSLLLSYLDQRVLFYTTRDERQLEQINARTAELQAKLWSAVLVPASAAPTPLSALALAGMNDVLNSQGYTQAAWWNRIPRAAWLLMIVTAICANLMIGFMAKRADSERGLLLIMPLMVAIALALISDIDSPRGGVIQLQPQNLQALAVSLRR
jgi:hypothetical protein